MAPSSPRFSAPNDPREFMRTRTFHTAVALVVLTRAPMPGGVGYLLFNTIAQVEAQEGLTPAARSALRYGVLEAYTGAALVHYGEGVTAVGAMEALAEAGVWFCSVTPLDDVPAQRTAEGRTAEDARRGPRPGDRYYTHLGDRCTVVSVTAAAVRYRLDDGLRPGHRLFLWSWRRSGEGYRWEAAPAGPPAAPVGDACAPGREVPPPKRTSWEARFNPQPGDRQYTDAGNTWVVVTVDGGGLMVDVYGGAADKEPWRGGMTREYWAASPPSAAFRWEPGPGAGAGAYAGPECDPAPPDFNARPARWCAGGPGVSCGAA